MPSAKLMTTVSSKGQVILPASIRRGLRWDTGTRLTVEETDEGVLLRQAPLFPATRPEDVFGSAHHEGPPLTLEDMDAAVEAEIRRRHAGDRY